MLETLVIISVLYAPAPKYNGHNHITPGEYTMQWAFPSGNDYDLELSYSGQFKYKWTSQVNYSYCGIWNYDRRTRMLRITEWQIYGPPKASVFQWSGKVSEKGICEITDGTYTGIKVQFSRK